MDKRPLILISNDDGVTAKGITELTACMRELGDVMVFAPDGPRSGMSGALTSLHPIKATLLKKEEGLTVYSCTGTPVDCVKLAMNEYLDHKPDLIVSGINHGTNVAICVHYSGTVGAAIEGCIFGVPSLAVSLTDHSPVAEFTESCRIAKGVASYILSNGLPTGVYLNLNIPEIPHVKGVRICRQAEGKWVNEFMGSSNAKGERVYWLTGNFEESNPDEAENDTQALNEGYASLVPCRIDVTDYDFLRTLKKTDFTGLS